MKKLLSLAAAAALIFTLSTCARIAPEPEPDYIAMMLQAVCAGDVTAGQAAHRLLCESFDPQSECGCIICFDELYDLSRAICSRFGGSHYSDELRLCMGEVLLNRVENDDYPDTLPLVIENAVKEGLIDLERYSACSRPDRSSAEVALRLLSGERMMESSVVLMSNERHEGFYSMFCSDIWGNTYFYESKGINTDGAS